MQDFYNFHMKDEFDYLLDGIKGWMGPKARKEFDRLAGKEFKPRDEKVFAAMLSDRLAIDLDGEHIPGKIGKVVVGGRRLGRHFVDVEPLDSIQRRKRLGLDKSHREIDAIQVPLDWRIYAGEELERAAGSGVADEFPMQHRGVGALNTTIANAGAIASLDALVDLLDAGSAGPQIIGYTASQPANPDVAIASQIECFHMIGDGTAAFGNAADNTGKATATAVTPTSDTDAPDTQTLAWVRVGSSNSADTILNALIDGEANSPSGGDWNFNTLAIVAGATVSASAWVVNMPESA
jgi:hypothetical protein